MLRYFTSIVRRRISVQTSSTIPVRLPTNAVVVSNQWKNDRNNNNNNSYSDSYNLATGLLALLTLSVSTTITNCDEQTIDETGVSYETNTTLTNWSATHSCQPKKIYEPKSAQEVARVLEKFHRLNEKVRPIGTALSPNGIGMSTENLLSLSNLDYVKVDSKRNYVIVGSGARVSTVLTELNKYGLTLQNFSSIQEQQMGGWTQVAAHGTGCSLPTVDEMIVRMQLATPTEGILTLSEVSNPLLFRYCKVGLGSLGIVTELTLHCIPKLKLLEQTYTASVNNIADGHYDRLKSYRHVRYMWLPHTKDVVVVVSNPYEEKSKLSMSAYGECAIVTKLVEKQSKDAKASGQKPTKPLSDLLLEIKPDFDRKVANNMTFSQLRDILLDFAPLDVNHIKKVNNAEAKFWSASAGNRLADSTEILGFDCGGEQLVLEVCFPIGSLKDHTNKDIDFVKKLFKIIEEHNLPAPCPIEQRWTAKSSAPMSPAYSENMDEIFSWVGVIMYLPPGQTEQQRQDIKHKFDQYIDAMEPLMDEYKAQIHWAKIELPSRVTNSEVDYQKKLDKLRSRVARKYNVQEFNKIRNVLDPNHILSNDLVEDILQD